MHEPRCIFCGRDPHEYVDIGVGFQAVAISCCDYGIGLYQHGDKALAKCASLLESGDKRKIKRATAILRRLPY